MMFKNFFFLYVFLFLSLFVMETLRVGSLNINGLREEKKRNLLLEFIRIKYLSIVFLQETHSTVSNEVDWGLWWEGERVLNHGTNVSAGVAVLFSPALKVNILSKIEIEPGRLVAVRAEIRNLSFLFVNIYAPNSGADRLQLFVKLEHFLKQQQDGDFIILGGDWNCTLDFTRDRND